MTHEQLMGLNEIVARAFPGRNVRAAGVTGLHVRSMLRRRPEQILAVPVRKANVKVMRASLPAG